jgi:small subunit ribosomal protein S9
MAKLTTIKGKRKRAIARATLRLGKGKVRVNGKLLNVIEPKLARLKIMEPLLLAEDVADKVDINVRVSGGGVMSQADAVRLAIGKALVNHNKKLEKIFLDYDRQLLVADVRRKEPSKPNRHGQARAKRQKSYR